MINFGMFCILYFTLLFGLYCALVYYNRYDYYKFTAPIGIITMIFVITLFILLLFFIPMGFVDDVSSIPLSKTEAIITLNDNTSHSTKGVISGGFMFTYGQVITKESTYYRTIAGDNKTGFQMTDLDIKQTKLFFIEDGTEPYLVTKYNEVKFKQSENWVFGGLIRVNNPIRTRIEVTGYELHIPESAVKIEFNIDMK